MVDYKHVHSGRSRCESHASSHWSGCHSAHGNRIASVQTMPFSTDHWRHSNPTIICTCSKHSSVAFPTRIQGAWHRLFGIHAPLHQIDLGQYLSCSSVGRTKGYSQFDCNCDARVRLAVSRTYQKRDSTCSMSFGSYCFRCRHGEDQSVRESHAQPGRRANVGVSHRIGWVHV